MQKEIQDSVREEAKRVDEITFQAGDVLDVKASIIILVITFLGTLSGQILSVANLPLAIRLLQVIGIIALCAAAILTILALWPRDFDIPRDPAQLMEYAKALSEHFRSAAEGETRATQRYEEVRMQKTQERITTNIRFASSKATSNRWAFYTVSLSLITDLVSLLWLALWHIHA